jgi:hypothetical protein
MELECGFFDLIGQNRDLMEKYFQVKGRILNVHRDLYS